METRVEFRYKKFSCFKKNKIFCEKNVYSQKKKIYCGKFLKNIFFNQKKNTVEKNLPQKKFHCQKINGQQKLGK